MKSYTPVRYLFAIMAAAVLALSASSASAQDEGRRGGRGGGRGGLGPDATPEQTAAYQEFNQGLQAQRTKVTEARTALADAVYAEKVDEAAIKGKVAALAKAEEELAIATAQGFAKIRSKLTADQITNIKAQAARGGGGGGGGGRGGRRGQQ